MIALDFWQCEYFDEMKMWNHFSVEYWNKKNSLKSVMFNFLLCIRPSRDRGIRMQTEFGFLSCTAWYRASFNSVSKCYSKSNKESRQNTFRYKSRHFLYHEELDVLMPWVGNVRDYFRQVCFTLIDASWNVLSAESLINFDSSFAMSFTLKNDFENWRNLLKGKVY